MSWKPIVVGVEASPAAAAAAMFASRAAERAGTRCYLVHATRDALASRQVPEGDRYRHALVDQARAQVVTALRDVVAASLLADLTVRIGATPVVLKEAVSRCGAELIVLGGKRHSTLGRWLGGSTSLAMARTTDVPVLVTTGSTIAIRRVLVAVDLSGAARPTLTAAERYAALFGAELRALSVLEPLPVLPEGQLPYPMWQEVLERDVWPLIQMSGVEKIVRHGMVVETIAGEASEWHADLVVVGTHAKGRLERVLLGSVTERLLHQLPTMLLVVPVPAAARVPAREARGAALAPPAVPHGLRAAPWPPR